MRFGEPDEIEDSVRGGMIWRYAFAEIHWPADDPDRPSRAADGPAEVKQPSAQKQPSVQKEPSRLAALGEAISGFARFVGGWVFYPGTQPRPPRSRRLPARIHALALVFAPDGKLHEYRYAPEEGAARVPASG